MNITEVSKALKFASPNLPILLIGPPGIGKTDIVSQHTMSIGAHFLVEHPLISDPTDFKGVPIVRDGEAYWSPIGTTRQICEPDCPPTVVLIDDLGQAPPSVQAATMQWLLARRFGEREISPNVTFVAASNRPSDSSGVRSLLAALINRVLLVSVEADASCFAHWALQQPDISPIVPAYARFRPDLFAATTPSEPVAFCTPRSTAALGRLMAFGCKDIELWGGLVGQNVAADILAYAKVADKLPDIRTLLDNPKTFKVPHNDPGLMHAVTVLAARYAMTKPAGFIGLAEHIGTEWGVAMVSDAVSVDPEFKAEAAFKSWAVKHRDVLL